jgi:hypothetical protein
MCHSANVSDQEQQRDVQGNLHTGQLVTDDIQVEFLERVFDRDLGCRSATIPDCDQTHIVLEIIHTLFKEFLHPARGVSALPSVGWNILGSAQSWCSSRKRAESVEAGFLIVAVIGSKDGIDRAITVVERVCTWNILGEVGH